MPLKPPKWVWQLATGLYVPNHEWDMLLKGYKNWHLEGARFGAGKGQGPDAKNFGVTLPSVAMSLLRYDQANYGGVVVRNPETYWTGVILAGTAVICRMRADRYVAEAESAVEFGLPSKNIVRKALRYVSKCGVTKCPVFYHSKLPAIALASRITTMKE